MCEVNVKSTTNGHHFETQVDGMDVALKLDRDLNAVSIGYMWSKDNEVSISTVNSVVCERFADKLAEFGEGTLQQIQKLHALLQ